MSESLLSARDLWTKALRIEGNMAGEFASTDPSDIWSQADVYTHVYAPLSALILDLCERLGRCDNVLQRLSEWDVLNLPAESGDDGPYWQAEIRKARSQ